MGCACAKACATAVESDEAEEGLSNKSLSNVRAITREQQNFKLRDLLASSSDTGRTLILKDRYITESARLHGGCFVEGRDTVERVSDHPGMGTVPGAGEGELVAAGWPSWLARMAGEAIQGWVPRNAASFEKHEKIGQGTYSRVYRARDLVEGKFVALKKVRFDNLDPESVRFMAREILILRRLDHPNVIKLEGLITSQMSRSLYLIFKYMEHDLTGLASRLKHNFTEAQIKYYMKQLLLGLDHCHAQSVLHRDIKGSNLLIDNNGILKIADFGLASFYNPHQSQPLTSRVVTLWYRPPELLLGATHYGVGVDLWSVGCILAELFHGSPILPGRTEVEQLHKIFKLCGSPSEEYWRCLRLPRATLFKPHHSYKRVVTETFKDFPSPALALVERLLSIDPADRGSAESALKSEFFTTASLPSDPSCLPNYPPSKEIDAKLLDEGRVSQVEAESKGQRHLCGERGSRDSRTVLVPGPEIRTNPSGQKRQGHTNPKRTNSVLISHPEQVSAAFVMPPSESPMSLYGGTNDLQASALKQKSHSRRTSNSGPLIYSAAWTMARENINNSSSTCQAYASTISSHSVAARSILSEDCKETPYSLGRVSKPISGATRKLNTGILDREQHHHKKRSSKDNKMC